MSIVGGLDIHRKQLTFDWVDEQKRRAKTDKADAKLLRELLAAGRLPECYIPPGQVLEWRALPELYQDLRSQHTGWAQRIRAVCSTRAPPHPGRPGSSAVTGPGSRRSSTSSCRSPDGCRSTPPSLSWRAPRTAAPAATVHRPRGEGRTGVDARHLRRRPDE
jgi:hypothetical protein